VTFIGYRKLGPCLSGFRRLGLCHLQGAGDQAHVIPDAGDRACAIFKVHKTGPVPFKGCRRPDPYHLSCRRPGPRHTQGAGDLAHAIPRVQETRSMSFKVQETGSLSFTGRRRLSMCHSGAGDWAHAISGARD